MIAFLEARRAGLFARGQWLPNIIAGVIVGVVALPLAMAFAIASGARPEQGFYTAIICGACVSLLGGSRALSHARRPTYATVPPAPSSASFMRFGDALVHATLVNVG